jgi:hypothetical protein
MVDKDSSVSFESPILDLELPIASVNYQLKWDVGVRGKFTWQATIFPDLWEAFVACEEVILIVDGSEEHSIISIPNSWLTAGFTRFVWVPDEGSTGNIDVASRIVPI